MRRATWRHRSRLRLADSLLYALSATAQQYPDKPIKLIVPLVAGSPIVSVGRVVMTAAVGAARAADRHRRAAGRRHHHRSEGRRRRAAGRLHAVHVWPEHHLRARPLSRSRRRSAQGFRPGREPHGVLARAGDRIAGAGEDAEGIRRLCEGQSRQAEFRRRARDDAVHRRRVFHPGCRRRHRQHPLPRRRAGARRYPGRPRPHEHRSGREPACR